MHRTNTETLLQIIRRIDTSYYDVTLSLCRNAGGYASMLQELEVQQMTSQYVSLCNRLIDEIRHYLAAKKERFIPYLLTLAEQHHDDHDCRTCEGKCDVSHNAQLSEHKRSQQQLRDIIGRVQMAALPLYAESVYPDVYKMLRNHMGLIENTLAELLVVEDTLLLPHIEAARSRHNMSR